MDRTFKLAACAVTLLTLLSEALAVTSPVWADRQSCPPIIASTSNHSTWFPVVHEGQDFYAWQQYTTTGYAEDLFVAWGRQPSSLGCSQFNITATVTDVHTLNTSIAVFNTRVDESCSDEGSYQVFISSNCTFNDSVIFNMTFDESDPCNKDTPPHPESQKSVVVPEPRPDTNDSTTLCVNIRYYGSKDITLYDTQWLLGEQGSCKDKDPNLLCEDDCTDEPGSVYICNRVIFGNCTFLSDICISNYSRVHSGNYTNMACPVSVGGPIGIISKLELSVIGWPKLTEWPGGMDSPTIDEMGAKLTYGLTNFSHKFLNITFYNGSELIANLTLFVEGYKVVITCEGCESTTVQLYIPAEGRYKMCYNFTNDVQWAGLSSFPPGYEVPNCTQYTQATPRKQSTILLLLAEIIGPIAPFAIMAIVIIILFIQKQLPGRRNPEAQSLVNARSLSINTYGSIDDQKTEGYTGDGNSGATLLDGQYQHDLQLHTTQTLPVDTKSPEIVQPGRNSVKTSSPEVQADTDYLRGVDVIAETHFVLTSVAQSFEWEEYGFKLHVPKGSLPEGLVQCDVKVKVSLSGHFHLPENSELVSAVYWVYSPYLFLEPLTVEIQHCVAITTPSQCAQLTFVRTKSTQNELPYNFKELDGGCFKQNTPYGTISITHFSGIATIFKKLTTWSWLGIFSTGAEIQYCGQLYILKRKNDWKLEFVVIQNLEVFLKVVREQYSAREELSLTIEFESDKICLEVPEDGETLVDDWKVFPLYNPVIMRTDVDNFEGGKKIPKCEMILEWDNKSCPPKRMRHKIDIQGARDRTFILLVVDPDTKYVTEASLHSKAGLTTQSSESVEHSCLQNEPQLCEFLEKVASKIPRKWQQVGIQLGLDVNDLPSASHDQDNIQCFVSVFDIWKNKQTSEFSWETIDRVLRSNTVGENLLANTVSSSL